MQSRVDDEPEFPVPSSLSSQSGNGNSERTSTSNRSSNPWNLSDPEDEYATDKSDGTNRGGTASAKAHDGNESIYNLKLDHVSHCKLFIDGRYVKLPAQRDELFLAGIRDIIKQESAIFEALLLRAQLLSDGVKVRKSSFSFRSNELIDE